MADRIGPIFAPHAHSVDDAKRMSIARPPSRCAVLRNNLLLIFTILSVFAGVGAGLALRPMNLSPTTLQLLNFPGEIFMQILRMMVLPLIVTSIISSLARMSSGRASMMGLYTVAYYATTAIIAATIGLVLVNTIKPGVDLAQSKEAQNLSTGDMEPIDTFLDLLRNMFPDNIFKATFMRVSTKYERGNGTNFDKDVVESPGTNILGIIVFSAFFGIVISRRGARVRIVTDFFIALFDIIMGYIKVVMWFAPFGILSLVAGNLIDVDDMSIIFKTLAKYVSTVLLGLFIQVVIVNPILYYIITRKSPCPVYSTMLHPFMIALGTGSSGASMPTSIACLEEHGIDSRIANFIPAFGNTLNVDGNALYEAVACIFIAQLNNIHLSTIQMVIISIVAALGSIGQGPVPAGMISMMVVLNTLGLPVKDLALIISVDWLCDRFRTAINVVGDGFAACIIAHIVWRRSIELGTPPPEEDYSV